MPFGEQPIRGGKSATISVAASDTLYKAGADFIGDGVCDEVEINQAIAALPALGGEVYLCEGTFTVCGPIVIDKNNVTIIGAGASTVIRVRDNHNVDINVIEATNRTNLLIKDLRIDGNRANQTVGLMRGIHFATVTNSGVVNCWIENTRATGIFLNICTNNSISGNICNTNNEDIQLFGGGTNNNTIAGNKCSNGAVGILIDGADYNILDGNECHTNTVGIYLTSAADYNVVVDNICMDNGQQGILLADDCSHNNIVSNIVVHNSQAADNTHDGIYLAGFSDYNNIQDNLVRMVAAPRHRYGINISAAACTGNLVANNDLHQSGQTAYFNDAGTGTKLPELWVNSIFDDQDANATLSNLGIIGVRGVTISMADGFDVTVRFNFRVPSDFHELVRARVVVVPDYAGPPEDMRRGVEATWGQCAELVGTGIGSIAAGEVAVSGRHVNCLDIDAALAGITAGDHVGVDFTREATNPLDTVDAAVHIFQFWMQYV